MPQIHPRAEFAENARVGAGTWIWHIAQIRDNAVIDADCIIGRGVYIDHGVHIGDRVKIQNNASTYSGTTVGDRVFVGPHVSITNDRYPRAIDHGGRADWTFTSTRIRESASLGAARVIVAGADVGHYALVGAGSVRSQACRAALTRSGEPSARARVRLSVRPCGPSAWIHGQLRAPRLASESGVLA